MKKLYSPADESELMVIKSMLESEDIPFYVQNDQFGSMYPGIFLTNFNPKTIMVPDEFYETAKDLISNFENES